MPSNRWSVTTPRLAWKDTSCGGVPLSQHREVALFVGGYTTERSRDQCVLDIDQRVRQWCVAALAFVGRQCVRMWEYFSGAP